MIQDVKTLSIANSTVNSTMLAIDNNNGNYNIDSNNKAILGQLVTIETSENENELFRKHLTNTIDELLIQVEDSYINNYLLVGML